ncbi:MBL fold metallo-hydrolase [Streptomyces sp. NPDC058891]|uniref:MBL fold metallo-hydrolase n=1 Tax=unclassified Streptomyces TaxID=2593676 RepID=UPI0036C888D8
MTELNYDVYVAPPIPLDPAAGIAPPDGSPAAWSPLSSTLIYGRTEALLVDPPITRAQGTAVAEWAGRFGRRVTTVYVTHAHGDHWFATAEIAAAFPGARVVTTQGVIDTMHALTPGGRRAAFWDALFPGLIGDTAIVAEPLSGELAVDGHPVLPIETGHSDLDNSTVLHVPSLDLVVAGDVIYNRVHSYLAEAGDGGLEAWLAAVERIAALHPRAVVAGHKDAARGDEPSAIDDTRRYLETAAAVLAQQSTRREYFDRMTAAFPSWLNPTIAWLSAVRLFAD